MESIPTATIRSAPANEPPARQASAESPSRSFADLLRAADAAAAPGGAQTDAATGAHARHLERPDRSPVAAAASRDGAAAARAGAGKAADAHGARTGAPADPEAKPARDTDAAAEPQDDDAPPGENAAGVDPALASQAVAGLAAADPAAASSRSATPESNAENDAEAAPGASPRRGRASSRLSALGREQAASADGLRRAGEAGAAAAGTRPADTREVGLGARPSPADPAAEPPTIGAGAPNIDHAPPAAASAAVPSPWMAAAPATETVASTTPQPAAGAPVAGPWQERQIAAPVGTPAFAPALGATLAVLTRDGIQQARLQINPAEMGPIAVHIAVEGQTARIDFHAAVAATRNALEVALPVLAGALHEAGLTLTGGGVHDQSAGRGEASATLWPAAERGAGGAGQPREGPPSVAGGPIRRGLVDLIA